MTTSVKNRLFLITGGPGGLGRGFAEAILKEGGKVALADIADSAGKEAVEGLAKQYGEERVYYVHLDVTKPEEFAPAWEATEAHFKDKIYGLVNNAGITGAQGWKPCIDINLLGVLNGTYFAVEKMSRAKGGSGGVILNTASGAGLAMPPDEEFAAYYISKHGVVTLTQSFGNNTAFARDGIRHLAICPFFVKTNLLTEDKKLWAELQRRLGDKHIMTVEFVADAFMTLLREGGNGAVLGVMPHMAPFFVPLFRENVFYYWMALGSLIFTKAFNVKTFRPWHMLIFFILTILVLNYLFMMLMGLFF